MFSAACTLPTVGTLSFLFSRLRRPTERAIVGDWVEQSHSRLPRWCPCTGGQGAPRGKTFVPPRTLAAENPARLRRQGVAAAAVPYCSTLMVGFCCTLLIALVVVTFDKVRLQPC